MPVMVPENSKLQVSIGLRASVGGVVRLEGVIVPQGSTEVWGRMWSGKPGGTWQSPNVSGLTPYVERSVAPGQLVTVTLWSGPIAPSGMTFDVLWTATLREGSQVITQATQRHGAVFQSVASPQIEIAVASIKSPVAPGEYAQAVLNVTNRGGSGSTTIAGATLDASGVQQGTWNSVTVTVGSGLTVPISMISKGTIHSMFAGQTLTAVFTTSQGRRVSASFRVSQLTTSTITTLPPTTSDPITEQTSTSPYATGGGSNFGGIGSGSLIAIT